MKLLPKHKPANQVAIWACTRNCLSRCARSSLVLSGVGVIGGLFAWEIARIFGSHWIGLVVFVSTLWYPAFLDKVSGRTLRNFAERCERQMQHSSGEWKTP